MQPVKIFAFVIAIMLSQSVHSQVSSAVTIPVFDDKYSKYVSQLEAGRTDIDYQDFRFSFLESEQFNIATKQRSQFDSLEKIMYSEMDKSNYPALIDITKQMLSIDYTSMIAHKILRQTYKLTGDAVNASKYKTIQFGLLNSIVQNGDGRTCATAWPVIQIAEEYFILQMVGATLKKQSIETKGGMCDRMEVKVDGKNKDYYFETSKIFEQYNKLFKK